MWRLLLRYLTFHKLRAVIIENAVIIVCVFIDVVRPPMVTWAPDYFALWFGRALVIALAFQIALHLRDAYDFRIGSAAPQIPLRLTQGLLMANAALAAVYVISPTLLFGDSNVALVLLRVSLFLIGWHIWLRLYFRRRRRPTNLLIMGTGRLARALAVEILHHRELGLAVCGFVDDDPSLVGVSIINPKVIGLTKDLGSIVTDRRIDKVVIELPDRRGRLPVNELLALKIRGTGIEEATSLYERVTGKIAVENLKPSWMLFNEGFEVSRTTLLVKETISFTGSFFLFLVSLPVLPLIATVIKLDSPGPIFHRQERVGQNGKIFTLWKFRTMRQDAERDTGPVWAVAQDSRITRAGKLLRRTRLDELPQLVNILKGDMTLVGPRPERPHFVEQLAALIPFYHLRHSVKPGVTGWAQVKYRYGNSVEDALEKLQYDLFYIKNMSWLLDSMILFNTAKIMLVRKGS